MDFFMKTPLRPGIIDQEETFLAWFTRVHDWFLANQTLIHYLQSYYTRVNLGDNRSKLEPIEIKLWFKLIIHGSWFLAWFNEILRTKVADVKKIYSTYWLLITFWNYLWVKWRNYPVHFWFQQISDNLFIKYEEKQ